MCKHGGGAFLYKSYIGVVNNTLANNLVYLNMAEIGIKYYLVLWYNIITYRCH